MKITILLFANCSALSALGSYDFFKKANEIALSLGDDRKQLFDVEMVGVHSNTVAELDGISLTVHKTINEVEQTDLIIIPGIDCAIDDVIRENSKVIPWIRSNYENGTDLASICTGAFLLAETGLLDGKKATTHWASSDLFKERYPSTSLLIQNIIVDEGRICSSGGATSFLNLVLYLIEKYGGKEVASICSKALLVESRKPNQNSYAIFSPQKSHNDDDILKIQEHIDINYMSPLSVKNLAEILYTSQRTFTRKFKSATGNTPLEYIQRVRVESAKQQLENSNSSINNIINSVGYEDLPSFRKLFSRLVGLSMSQYRRRYQMNLGTMAISSS